MNWRLRSARAALAIVLVMVAAACGSTSSGTGSKGTITIAGFKFSEGTVLMQLYGQALAHDGYTVNYKPNLGSREVVAPAIENGQVDLYIGYAATDLEFYNKGAGEASGDVNATVAKLNQHLQTQKLEALNPSNTVDQNAFAVTKATADKYNLKKISDLGPVASKFILGGPPECKTRPFCLPGLQSTYGLHFKDFKSLQLGTVLKSALMSNAVQVGLVFSSDADLNQDNLVVLDDDKHLQSADNVVPIIRTAVASDEVKRVLNAISARLTTADLVGLNAQVELQHQDADVATKAWLESHGYGM